ncbi:ABC transporter ATP-binding protein [Natronospirillum operosum]|uniref:ABC-type dipeptide transporter n=1 Tax=Natronospirillum operosum TaxID=2759953 RepID=A0A4Z0W9P7_9GAMM|nr:ABC transporter ATP-binding protein [Natronospirillum operosum]TGG94872.1 ABC transporter ATP-binding protein [Natronospirillum operosum]
MTDSSQQKQDQTRRTVLAVDNLQTRFMSRGPALKAVDGVSFSIGEGETVALVGESGCGKSVTAQSLLRLISPPGQIVGGHIYLEGDDLMTRSQSEIEDIRGNRAAMIFQEPLTALNPIMTVEKQLAEVLHRHHPQRRKEARAQVLDMLQKVGIPDPEGRLRAYPHQLSGGMRQRVMIAMALLSNPRLLIADEPTTALDVTIQAQILELMRNLCSQMGTALLLITHDLGVVAEMADRVIVMYAGRVVEEAPVRTLFAQPAHPYTRGLIQSTPNLATHQGQLVAIPGLVPTLADLGDVQGCKFAPRCSMATDKCRSEDPPLQTLGPDRAARCWYADEVMQTVSAQA